jgi:hypothetical protein
MLYLGTGVLTCLILHEYLLHVHRNGRILDLWRRINGPIEEFFLPDDYEITCDELIKIIASAKAFKSILPGSIIKRNVVIHEGIEKDPNDNNYLGKYKRVIIYQNESNGKQFIFRHFLCDSNGKITEIFNDVIKTETSPKRAFQDLLLKHQSEAIHIEKEKEEKGKVNGNGIVTRPLIENGNSNSNNNTNEVKKSPRPSLGEEKSNESKNHTPRDPSPYILPIIPHSARSQLSQQASARRDSRLTSQENSPRVSPRIQEKNESYEPEDDDMRLDLYPQEEDYQHQEELLRENRKQQLLNKKKKQKKHGRKGGVANADDEEDDEEAYYHHDDDDDEGSRVSRNSMNGRDSSNKNSTTYQMKQNVLKKLNVGENK